MRLPVVGHIAAQQIQIPMVMDGVGKMLIPALFMDQLPMVVQVISLTA